MAFQLRSIRTAVLVLVSSACLTVACDDDEGEGDDESSDEPAICKEISEVCHDAAAAMEDGGMAHDCHEQAHSGTAESCEMIRDECIAVCTGGGESSGGSSSG